MGNSREHDAWRHDDILSRFDDMKMIRRSAKSAAKISTIVLGSM